MMTTSDKSLTKLSINLNKVALVRNARALDIPSVLTAATCCLRAGADGITVHPRPDERHIKARDVYALAELLQDFPRAEFNIEGNPLYNLMEFVRAVRPTQVTFVPDTPEQSTSDHGWDFSQQGSVLRPFIEEAQDLGVRVSLFADATQPENLALAHLTGANRVELYTQPWAQSFGQPQQQNEQARRFAQAARIASESGLQVNAGHDLNRHNLCAFLQAVPEVIEVSIGHAFIADALELGYQAAVETYLEQIQRARK